MALLFAVHVISLATLWHPNPKSMSEWKAVPRDNGTNVSLDYKEGNNAFARKINKVTISLKLSQFEVQMRL